MTGSWFRVTFKNGDREVLPLGTSFTDKLLWRVEIQCTLDDLYSEAMEKWLKMEVQPKLINADGIEIVVVK